MSVLMSLKASLTGSIWTILRIGNFSITGVADREEVDMFLVVLTSNVVVNALKNKNYYVSINEYMKLTSR
jgi:hypothetical protein